VRTAWLASLLVALLAETARACTCSGVLDTAVTVVSPPPGVLLPLNGRVRLRTDVSARVESAVLRAASGDVVTVRLERRAPGAIEIADLVPVRLLYPGTKYEIVVRRARGKGKDEVVGSVTTGTGEDRTAPVGGKVKEAFVHAMSSCGWCCSEGVRGEIHVEGVADFGMAPVTLAWQVEVGDQRGWAFDPRLIDLGLTPWSCGPALFPRPQRKVRVIARPVDLAGNLGPPIEAILDFAHPEPWRKTVK
jgi:hypothetical protein